MQDEDPRVMFSVVKCTMKISIILSDKTHTVGLTQITGLEIFYVGLEDLILQKSTFFVYCNCKLSIVVALPLSEILLNLLVPFCQLILDIFPQIEK